jgi:predicted amidohydrolase
MKLQINGLLTAWPLLFAVGLLTLVAARSALADDTKYTVAAVQSELRFYASEEDFAAHMAEGMAAAMKFKPDLVVFPEDVGLPLVALGDQDALAGVKSLHDAIAALVHKHMAEIGPICTKYGVSPQRALFLFKADQVKQVYTDTFSHIAHENKTPTLAGSVPMRFQYAPSDVYNVSCEFSNKGRMHIVAEKVHPIDIELADGLDLSPAKPEDSRPFNAGNARVGCLVCADAWDPAMAKRLVDDGAEILVQVSANPSLWTKEEQARWHEGLWTRVQELGVYGVTCMGIGNLVGLPFEGITQIQAPKAWTDSGDGVLAEAPSATAEAVVVAVLDLSRIRH